MNMHMTEDALIIKINKLLKESWTKKETSEGKRVEMDWAWAKTINSVVKRYKSKGWTVTKHVETDSAGRHLYLTFKNSLWLSKKKSKKRRS